MARRKETPRRRHRVHASSAKSQGRPSGARRLLGGALTIAALVAVTLVVHAQWPMLWPTLWPSLLWSAALESPQNPASASVPRAARLRADVVDTYPHDRAAFTQGLELNEGALYESTGLAGRSSLRRVEVETGRVLRRLDIPAPIFAEGLAIVGRRLVQLTYRSGQAFEYDLETFQRLREHTYAGEGWGLCYDGAALVMSNGSSRLAYRDPETFEVQRELEVTLAGRPLVNLNELECVGESVYANVWSTEMIVRIDRRTGRVTERIDASGLLSAGERRATDVMNGIAYDASTKTFLITGKLWPRLFRVRFVPVEPE